MFENVNFSKAIQEVIRDSETIKNLQNVDTFKTERSVPNGRKLVISDFDEVIVSIVLKWIHLGKEVGIFDPEISSSQIYNRKNYYISEFIDWERVKHYIKDPNIKTKDQLALTLFDQKGFYDDLLISKLGNALKQFSENKLIDLVIISHHHPDWKNLGSKIDFIQKNFPNSSYHIINPNQRKSWVVNSAKLNDYTTFIDDSLVNIYDMILNTQSVGKEFIIPKYGYNDVFYTEGISIDEIREKKNPTKMDIDMIDIIEAKGCTINYVDPL